MTSLADLYRRLRGRGVWWALGAARDRVLPPKSAMTTGVLDATTARVGLEVGGPSRIFGRRGSFPVYGAAARIDNVNFAAATAWESSLRDGGAFRFDARKPPGRQWIREAVALSDLNSEAYDFVLSSHCLEHVANPLAALHEWRRVTKPGGRLLLVLPDPVRTFDHRRPISTLQHLREDFARGTREDDATHLTEAIDLHDVALDAGVRSHEEFRARACDNARNRCVHHHVFDLPLIVAMLADARWQVLATETLRPMHLVAFAQKDSV